MTVETKKIVKFCEDYLRVKNWTDFCLNGPQIEGAPKVSKIITGVSLSKKLIEIAVKKRAKMIIVHHGIFIRSLPSPLVLRGFMKERIKMILANDINLLGFHLPLDAHPVIGNNISLAKLLGMEKAKAFTDFEHGEVGFIGQLKKSVSFKEFIALVNEKLQTNSYIISAGPKKIKTIAIVSGGASSDFKIAADLGADTFLCGDIREDIVRAVEETRINFINAGHYNTEKIGIQNLGALISRQFKIKTEFIDIPNDI